MALQFSAEIAKRLEALEHVGTASYRSEAPQSVELTQGGLHRRPLFDLSGSLSFLIDCRLGQLS